MDRSVSILLPDLLDSSIEKLNLGVVTETKHTVRELLETLGLPYEATDLDTKKIAQYAVLTELTELSSLDNYTSPQLIEKLFGLLVGQILAMRQMEINNYPPIGLVTGEETIRLHDHSNYRRQGENVVAKCGKIVKIEGKIYGKYSVVYGGSNRKYTAIHDLETGETSSWHQIRRGHELTEDELIAMTNSMSIKIIPSNDDIYE